MSAILTIEWEFHKTWRDLVKSILDPFLREDWKTSLKRSAPSFPKYIDDSDWTSVILKPLLTVTIPRAEKALFKKLLTYKVRAFHGCRPLNVDSYLQRGIESYSRDDIEKRALDLVAENLGLGIFVERNKARLADHRRDGSVYTVLSRRWLIKDGSHYLMYGSEYLGGLVEPRMDVLVKRGVPTIIEVELPLSEADKADVKSLAKRLLHEWIRLEACPDDSPRKIDFSFRHDKIPPEWVVGHSHPSKIADPDHCLRTIAIKRPYCATCRP